MELTQENINYVRTSFGNIKTKGELVSLLNYVKPILYGEEAVPFELKQITFYANPKINPNRYIKFGIEKKDGSIRVIHAPSPGSKAIQKCLNLILQIVFEPHPAATGFVTGKSIVDNAKVHAGSNYVYNIDLKDFFPSIEQARVWRTLQLPPFNLGKSIKTPKKIPGNKWAEITESVIKNDVHYQRLQLNNLISALVCYEMEVERQNESEEWIKIRKNVLPQGAPTSPIITNIICQKLDFILTGVAKKFGMKYTRYADDITFSSMHSVFAKNSPIKNDAGRIFIEELQRVIREQGFHIKESKVRLQRRGYRQEVTGLIVNDTVNINKRYLKKVRVWLHRWELFGFEKAEDLFLRDYLKDRGNLVKGKPNMENVLQGKILYLEMVKGKDHSTSVTIRKRFEKLKLSRVDQKDGVNLGLTKIFEVLRNEGLASAREKFPL